MLKYHEINGWCVLLSCLALIYLSLSNGCVNSNENLDVHSSHENLINVVWVLDSLQTPDTTIVPRLGSAAMRFTSDMEVIGHSEYSEYRGSFTAMNQESIRIEILDPDDYFCGQPHLFCIFLDALKEISAYQLSEETLDLYHNEAGYFISFHASLYDDRLVNRIWRVDSLIHPYTGKMILRNDEVMTVEFTEFMTTVARHCNTGEGAFVIPYEGSLTVTYLSITAMACNAPPRLDSLELGFFSNLFNVGNYLVDQDYLKLFDEEETYMLYLTLDSIITSGW